MFLKSGKAARAEPAALKRIFISGLIMPLLTSATISSASNPWLQILSALEKKINRHSYDTWLKPTRYSHAKDGHLFVRVPTQEFRHIGEKYADLIQEAIEDLHL